ncbi:MAG: DNA primase [Desulfuromonadales bacterium]|jgi:DNA primase|nr:DNA primase [Desulfuromonadales bacterium]MDH3807049.1 DNA primase [Desulfuromonadales bacterium]MDH3868115.1 DNA primase [Desulfuromonadales bacterium]MDH4024221.1 DNA primase [Desulfuromonadales bacterium]
MGRIADEKIDEIRERTDIVEVVSSYLPLKRSGVNHQGLCPFHQEKSPSFNVNSARQIFHCFGCGVGGNVFSFLMRMEGLSFPDAVRRLGEKVGVEVEEEAVSPEEVRRRDERERILRINEVAGEFYQQLLLTDEEGAPGRRYLRQRGYESEIVRTFQLGFAPGGWESLAKHLAGKSFSSEDSQKAGLVRPGKQERGNYDLFRNRLLFPIHDLQGRMVAFGGRVLDDSLPKYINSPETAVYHKGQTLYGLYQARDAMRHNGEALVVEGYFDVLALHRAGFSGAVATCGTALTADHARLLKRYADKILLIFDEDAAGRQATFRAMDALVPAGLSVSVVTMPVGEDPDSLLKEKGEEGFRLCLDAARPVLEVFIEDQLRVNDESVEGRARAAEQVLERIKRLPGDLERSLYVKRLAELTGLDVELLKSKVRGGVPALKQGRTPTQSNRVRKPAAETGQTQKYLLRLMLMDDQQRRLVRQEGTADLFIDDLFRELADYLLSREDEQGNLPDDLIDAALDADQQSLLTSLTFQETGDWADNADKIFTDCRRAASNYALKRRLKEISSLEDEARNNNDEAGLTKYLRERVEINQKLKKKL